MAIKVNVREEHEDVATVFFAATAQLSLRGTTLAHSQEPQALL